ncbi:hypothetical protein HDU76_008970 [Blyttiomyces sp. JEL0837]|nr:hypothetical protein HDU76_008970 [Blyttiomyces sp. JEL0837]
MSSSGDKGKKRAHSEENESEETNKVQDQTEVPKKDMKSKKGKERAPYNEDVGASGSASGTQVDSMDDGIGEVPGNADVMMGNISNEVEPMDVKVESHGETPTAASQGSTSAAPIAKSRKKQKITTDAPPPRRSGRTVVKPVPYDPDNYPSTARRTNRRARVQTPPSITSTTAAREVAPHTPPSTPPPVHQAASSSSTPAATLPTTDSSSSTAVVSAGHLPSSAPIASTTQPTPSPTLPSSSPNLGSFNSATFEALLQVCESIRNSASPPPSSPSSSSSASPVNQDTFAFADVFLSVAAHIDAPVAVSTPRGSSSVVAPACTAQSLATPTSTVAGPSSSSTNSTPPPSNVQPAPITSTTSTASFQNLLEVCHFLDQIESEMQRGAEAFLTAAWERQRVVTVMSSIGFSENVVNPSLDFSGFFGVPGETEESEMPAEYGGYVAELLDVVGFLPDVYMTGNTVGDVIDAMQVDEDL